MDLARALVEGATRHRILGQCLYRSTQGTADRQALQSGGRAGLIAGRSGLCEGAGLDGIEIDMLGVLAETQSGGFFEYGTAQAEMRLKDAQLVGTAVQTDPTGRGGAVPRRPSARTPGSAGPDPLGPTVT